MDLKNRKIEETFWNWWSFVLKNSDLIKKYYTENRKQFRYTLVTFQDELPSIIGEQIKLHIARENKELQIVAIIADETQDITEHK